VLFNRTDAAFSRGHRRFIRTSAQFSHGVSLVVVDVVYHESRTGVTPTLEP